MKPAAIVEEFDVVRNLSAGDLTGWELFPVDELDFQRPVGRFGQCIVVADPGSPNRLTDSEVAQFGGCLLYTSPSPRD